MLATVENRDDVFCNTTWVALGKKKSKFGETEATFINKERDFQVRMLFKENMKMFSLFYQNMC